MSKPRAKMGTNIDMAGIIHLGLDSRVKRDRTAKHVILE